MFLHGTLAQEGDPIIAPLHGQVPRQHKVLQRQDVSRADPQGQILVRQTQVVAWESFVHLGNAHRRRNSTIPQPGHHRQRPEAIGMLGNGGRNSVLAGESGREDTEYEGPSQASGDHLCTNGW
jgi:hypothetical protein